jgi:hypothetical protein
MKYIFIDIDGTLFSNELQGIPESSKIAIKKARDAGNKIFLCTGRSLAEATKYLNLEIDGFVLSSGAVVYCNGKNIFNSVIKRRKLEYMLDVFRQLDIGYCFAGKAGGYCNDSGLKYAYKYLTKGATDYNFETVRDEGFFGISYWDRRDQVSKISIYADNLEKIDEVKPYLQEEFSYNLVLSDIEHNIYISEITASNIDKSYGINKALEYYGASFRDCVAIGDSANDIDMIKNAEIGIAMGNAQDEVKEVADYITTDILDDGVYNAFREFGLFD